MKPLIHRQDWIASLVLCVIALPLSLGIALASGATPAAGLITAVIGGVVTGLIAGAPLAVTGPAAGLSALVFQFVQEYGIVGLGVITVAAGFLQVAMGSAKLGALFRLIPKPVLEGVLSAIGWMIVLGQLHVLAGFSVPTSPTQAVLTLPGLLWTGFTANLATMVPILFCGVLGILIQLLWPRMILFSALTRIPRALPAVVFVTLVATFWNMPRVALSPLLPVAANGLSTFFSLGWWTSAPLQSYLLAAFTLAFVASAETLITAQGVDILAKSANPSHTPAKLNQELVAQGVTNILSGVSGGLPVTAVMVRSAANIDSGARTRFSSVLHGIWIALFVGAAPFVLEKIPLTALAAVLILTGAKLTQLSHCVHALRKEPKDGAVWIFTTSAILVTDLMSGIAWGMAGYLVANIQDIQKRLKRLKFSEYKKLLQGDSK